MVQQSSGVRMRPPPPAVMRVVNLAMRPLLRSRVGERVSNLMLVEVRGRRTGRALAVPATCHVIDAVPHAMTDRPWRLNFAGGADATLVRHGRRQRARGTLLDLSPDQAGILMRQLLDGGTSPRALGLVVARGHTPSTSELGALGQSFIRFDLEPDV
jgi:hypothetical protein